MIKIAKNYNDDTTEIVWAIANDYLNSGKEDIVIFNIGTDKCLGDSLGPVVGTLLKSSCTTFEVIGDMESPAHALNIERRYNELIAKKPNAFVIAVDASISPKAESLHNLIYKNKPISPGEGVDKKLIKIGDVSVAGIMSVDTQHVMKALYCVRLHHVFEMAQAIKDIILKFEQIVKIKSLNELEALSV